MRYLVDEGRGREGRDGPTIAINTAMPERKGKDERKEGRKEVPPRPSIIQARSLSSNSVAGAALAPRLRNQDGIEKGISCLQLKLPTSISISAPIYSHRPYKRVCSYIGFSLYRSFPPRSALPNLSTNLLLFLPLATSVPLTYVRANERT